MNFATTERIINFTDKFIPKAQYIVQTEDHKNYFGQAYTADYVVINDPFPYHIAIEVVENEIIIFFFGDHIHFEDYTSELENGMPNYLDRAIEFLEKLFCYPIERRRTFKGDKVIRDESLLVESDNAMTSIGVTYSGAGLKNLFKKSTKTIERFAFDRETQSFCKI